jgi:hypothetical protein
MAAAVLIDATVVRGVLLPAALSLVGASAWRLRRRADHGAARSGISTTRLALRRIGCGSGNSRFRLPRLGRWGRVGPF